jgi:pimeloyl-ACP methyl ester carboxylesterase
LGGEGVIAAPPASRMLRDLLEVFRPVSWITPPDNPEFPRGDGHAVMFAPGIAAGDLSTLPIRRFVARLGYQACGWELGTNLGPTTAIVSGMERRLAELNDRTGQKVTLIGRSLGGVLLRELAKMHPDRVRRLILVCSPVHHPVASLLAPLVLRFDRFYSPAFSRDPEMLNRPAPVPTVAFHTKSDGYIAWRHCVEQPSPLVENIELPGAGHCTASLHPVALRVIASRLPLC